MQGLDADAVAGIMVLGGSALLLAGALPALLRRAWRTGRRMVARLGGGMRPFGGRAFVIDGDTIVVRGVRVRLFGMDAPEMRQSGGAAARAHLVGLIGGVGVEVEPCDLDMFGRTVAVVRSDGRDLSRALVRDGFARAAPYWSWAYLGTEIRARRRRRGLWAACRFTGIEDPALHRRRQALALRGRR